MAVIKEGKNQYGDVYPNAYYKVRFYAVDTESKENSFVIFGYKDKAAKLAGKAHFFEQRYTLPYSWFEGELPPSEGASPISAQPVPDKSISFDDVFGYEKINPDTKNPVSSIYENFIKKVTEYKDATDDK